MVAEAAGEIKQLVDTFRRHSRAVVLVHNLVEPRWRVARRILDGQVGSGQERLHRSASTSASRRWAGRTRAFTSSTSLGWRGRSACAAGRTSAWRCSRASRSHPPLCNAPRRRARAAICARWPAGRASASSSTSTTRCGAASSARTGRRRHQARRRLPRQRLRRVPAGDPRPAAARRDPRDLQQEQPARRRRGVREAPGDAAAARALRRPPRSTGTTRRESCVRIAKKLNIGLDRLVFVDDNPVERNGSAQMHPEVDGDRAAGRPGGVRAGAAAIARCSSGLRCTDEDRRRAGMYAEQRSAAS